MKQAATRAKADRPGRRRKAILAVGILAVCVLAAVLIGRYLDPNRGSDEPKGNLDNRFTAAPVIDFNGEQYTPKENLTVILLMGTDHYVDEDASDAGSAYRSGGQADFLVLIVADADTQTITPVQIDRDTMAEVTTLGILGNETGTRLTQICLAHGFGDGKEQSCELQRDAVSRLLCGVNIPYYVAMSLDGISTLNDAVGGVTVTISDDFTKLDPAMSAGATLTLAGEQAEYFVRNRMDIGVGTNEARSVRQKQYWDALVSLMDQRMQEENDTDFLHVIFNQLEPYLTTNLSRGRLINEIWKNKDFSRQTMVQPEGEYTIGEDGFVEFHADEEALQTLVMRLFYQKVS